MEMRDGYIEVRADALMRWWGWLTGTKPKAGALYPFW